MDYHYKELEKCKNKQEALQQLLVENSGDIDQCITSIKIEKISIFLLFFYKLWVLFKDISPLLLICGLGLIIELCPEKIIAFNSFMNSFLPFTFEFSKTVLVLVFIPCTISVYRNARIDNYDCNQVKEIFQLSLELLQQEKQEKLEYQSSLENCLKQEEEHQKALNAEINKINLARCYKIALDKKALYDLKEELQEVKQTEDVIKINQELYGKNLEQNEISLELRKQLKK